MSCQSWDDGLLGKAAARGNGAATETGQIIAVGTGDALDQAEGAQTAELARYRGGRELVEDRQKVGAANAGDIEGRPLKDSSRCSMGLKKLMPLTVLPATTCGVVRRSNALAPAEKSSRAERKVK